MSFSQDLGNFITCETLKYIEIFRLIFPIASTTALSHVVVFSAEVKNTICIKRLISIFAKQGSSA